MEKDHDCKKKSFVLPDPDTEIGLAHFPDQQGEGVVLGTC